MKKEIFKGAATALITPYREGKIDYTALKKIIDMQIESGVGALVVGGTTAEAATLNPTERRELYEFARDATRGRAALIFGTGTNDTEAAVALTRLGESIGCDAALVVTPYYNKGTVDGVTKHYLKIANCSDLPIIVYNVPIRTGVNLTFGQFDEFAKCEKIVGVKEATDSIERFVRIAKYGNDLPLYSGNDTSIYPTLALGGYGVISVLSNLLPKEVSSICTSYFQGELATSLKLQLELFELMNIMFIETNPSPIKYAMSLMGLCTDEVRLPLAPPNEASKKEILKMLIKTVGRLGAADKV